MSTKAYGLGSIEERLTTVAILMLLLFLRRCNHWTHPSAACSLFLYNDGPLQHYPRLKVLLL